MIRRWKETEPVRLYVYGLVGPALAVAIVYGVLSAEQAAVWAVLAAAVLIPGTEAARRRVSPVRTRGSEHH